MTTTPRAPFRADHVGSFLRPDPLKTARRAFEAGTLDAASLHAAEDRAIRDVVAMQEAVGLHGVTDGEYRRASFHVYFLEQLDGTAIRERPPAPGENRAFAPRELVIEGRIGHARPIEIENFAFLKSATRRTPKLTIPSPTMLLRGGRAGISKEVYPDLELLEADTVAAYRDEIAALAQAGCTYLQFDDTNLAYLCDPRQRELMAARGHDVAALPGRYARLINQAIAGRPEDMALCIHLCRGNFQSHWAAEGPYDDIAEVLFGEIAVDGYFLEYDTGRAGGFEPLRFLPKGKKAVLGLVSSKLPELESKDSLKRRIDDAARFAPLDQLCLSPQCGFASHESGNLIGEDDQKRKLELVVAVADEVWGSAA